MPLVKTGSADLSNTEWRGFGTVQAGLDGQLDAFVVGVLADYDFYFGDGSQGSTTISDVGTVSYETELKNVWSVGGRAGLLAMPNLLLYGMGGYSQARLDGNVAAVADLSLDHQPNLEHPDTRLSVKLPDELHGFFVGGGGEIRLTDNLGLKLEYRYTRFQSESASGSVTNVGAFQQNIGGGPSDQAVRYKDSLSVDADLDTEIHSVRGVFVVRLGS